MPSDGDRAALSDIASNIDLALTFIEGIDYDRFVEDYRTFYAITRCLEIVSEASRHLSQELKARHPDTPWRRIAGMGNIYRHDYEDVLHHLVWATVHEFLPTLAAVVELELGTV
jgi:uncharacterized protein with HEPN domain